MNFLSINDIKQAAYKKYQRVVKSIEPIAFEYNAAAGPTKLPLLAACENGVTGYLSANGNNGNGVALGKVFSINGGAQTMLWDKCFYGSINMSWLFDSTYGSPPCLASHFGADISQSLPATARTIEWMYQEVFSGAPTNASINVNLNNVFFDEIWCKEQTPTLCAKGSGYLIHFQ